MSNETITDEFDPCLNLKDVEPPNKTLLGFFGQEVKIQDSWEKHWKGTPRFSSTKENIHIKELMVKFSTEEELEEFAKLLKQTITMKTKSIWFPAREATTSIKRWISEEQIDSEGKVTLLEPPEEEQDAD